MNVIDRILEEAKGLTEGQRLSLAHRLLIVDQPGNTEEVENAWDIEIRKRIHRYDEGKTMARDANEVFKDLDHRLNR